MKKVKQLYLFKEVESHMRITDKIYVRAHQRNNGSYVREHWRKKPAKRGGPSQTVIDTGFTTIFHWSQERVRGSGEKRLTQYDYDIKRM